MARLLQRSRHQVGAHRALSADPIAGRVLLARLRSLQRLDAAPQEDYARLL